MSTVAFLGTGTMGYPMARNIARAGIEVRAWNRTREKADPLASDGATVCDTPSEAAAGAEIVVTMLSDADTVTATVSEALDGAEDPPGIWAQMSTIGPEGTARCAELAERLGGLELVDAPVLGTREPAEQRKLVVLASGPQQARARCRSLFEALGRTIELGATGDSSRAKLVLNSWVLGVTGLVAETISLAEALEIEPRVFFDAVDGSALDLPYARLKGNAMIERDFGDAAFRLALARKDADLVVQAAARQSLETPVLLAVAERLRRAEEAGHGGEDMAATFLAFERDERS